MKDFSFGAFESDKDSRTIKHESLVQVTPRTKGGIPYQVQDVLHQHKEGICTAISLIQNRQKATGKVYSPEFQYLLQKKFYDGNWTEGSSILNALKVGKKYGFLPIAFWDHTTEADRFLPYEQYIAKLQAISDSEIQRLIGLCTDKIPGYAAVNTLDPQAIAKAIDESDSGVLCMYYVGDTWWSPSWKPADINPLRRPQTIVGGHAIVMNLYDYEGGEKQVLTNTWGSDWCLSGCASILYDDYYPMECWAITRDPIIKPFNNNLGFGATGEEVVNLQNALKISGCFAYNSTGYFGILTWSAVKKYQAQRGISTTGFCGPLTRESLNKKFI